MFFRYENETFFVSKMSKIKITPWMVLFHYEKKPYQIKIDYLDKQILQEIIKHAGNK